jgi:glycosyltransferase involved in cell wall biosynthesis
MLRVTAYTGGGNVPSARLRVRQYIPALQRLGIEMRESGARFGSYPPSNRALRPGWGLLALTERFRAAVAHRDADVTLLQREMLSTFATVERFTKAPRVLDVDDAIWLLRDGQCAVSLARLCDGVICGNAFVAEFFRKHCPKVAVLSTAVDTERLRPLAIKPHSKVICWSGTSSGFRFLEGIEGALSAILSADPERWLRIVSDTRPRLRSIPDQQIEFVRWSERSEVAAIQDSAVGIMPLDDSPWSRGKCSYKLLAYMACGIPVIATPVGMNSEVLGKGDFGLPARTHAEWADAVDFILKQPERARAMGSNGREIAVRDYSIEALAPRLSSLLHGISAN